MSGGSLALGGDGGGAAQLNSTCGIGGSLAESKKLFFDMLHSRGGGVFYSGNDAVLNARVLRGADKAQSGAAAGLEYIVAFTEPLAAEAYGDRAAAAEHSGDDVQLLAGEVREAVYEYASSREAAFGELCRQKGEPVGGVKGA